MTELHPQSRQARMSRRILTALRKNPSNLNMGSWFDGSQAFLLPKEKPACNTTMCVAGWAAHFDGWEVDINGVARKPEHASSPISHAGRQALRLPENPDSLFYTDNDIAVACLMRMASGEAYHDGMVAEESAQARAARGDHCVYDAMHEYQEAIDSRMVQLLGVDIPAAPVAR